MSKHDDDEIADRIVGAAFRLVLRALWLLARYATRALLLILAVALFIWLLVWASQFHDAIMMTIACGITSFVALLIAANIWSIIKWWKAI